MKYVARGWIPSVSIMQHVPVIPIVANIAGDSLLHFARAASGYPARVQDDPMDEGSMAESESTYLLGST